MAGFLHQLGGSSSGTYRLGQLDEQLDDRWTPKISSSNIFYDKALHAWNLAAEKLWYQPQYTLKIDDDILAYGQSQEG